MKNNTSLFKKLGIVFSLVLLFGMVNNAFAQDSSLGSTYVGNYGVTSTLKDPWTGDVASFWSINTGGGSTSFDPDLEYYLAQVERDVANLKSDDFQREYVYKPGQDLECEPTLVTVDEMLKGLKADDSFFISSDLTHYTIEQYSTSGVYGVDCYVEVRSLDDSFGVLYDEMIFINEKNAKHNFDLVSEQILSLPSFSTRYTETQSGNLDANSLFISAEASPDNAAYAQIFQKDEYVVALQSFSLDGTYLLKGNDVENWSSIIRDRVNTSPYDSCYQYFSAEDAMNIFGNVNGRINSEIHDQMTASEKFGPLFPSEVTNLCYISLGFPHEYYRLSDVNVFFNVMSFPSENSAKFFFDEEYSDFPDNRNYMLKNRSDVSAYVVFKNYDSDFNAIVLHENNILKIEMYGYSTVDENDPPWAFTLTDNITSKTLNTFLDNYFEYYATAQPITDSSVDSENSMFSQDSDNISDNTPVDTPDNTNGGCLIATAAFGTELAPQVQFLREIRDNTVMSTSSGTAFMTGFNQLYYSFSPTIADWERQNPVFQEAIRLFITPMISTLSIMTLAEPDSESSVLITGISVILLNLGMYVGVPVYGIMKLKQYNSKKNLH